MFVNDSLALIVILTLFIALTSLILRLDNKLISLQNRISRWAFTGEKMKAFTPATMAWTYVICFIDFHFLLPVRMGKFNFDIVWRQFHFIWDVRMLHDFWRRANEFVLEARALSRPSLMCTYIFDDDNDNFSIDFLHLKLFLVISECALRVKNNSSIDTLRMVFFYSLEQCAYYKRRNQDKNNECQSENWDWLERECHERGNRSMITLPSHCLPFYVFCLC